MKKIMMISLLLTLGCTPRYLSNNLTKEISNICLNFDGNGRLKVSGNTYTFSAESLLDEKEHKWMMSMSFPLHGQEIIELDLSMKNSEFIENIQQKLLRENSDVDPKELAQFMKQWARYINEIVHVKKYNKAPSAELNWTLSKELLTSKIKIEKSSSLGGNFYNPEESYFSRMDFSYESPKKNSGLKVELIVRKCLDKK